MPSTATSILDGLSTSVAVKAPCKTVSTTNIALSGLQTISGVALAEGDRILVKGQSNPVNNGIYVVSTGSWTRSKDFDGQRDAVQGTRVIVRSTDISGVEYELTTANPIVLGTSSLTFVLRYGANAVYDQTEGEIAAGVVPSHTSYQPGYLLRFGTNTVPGTTDLATPFQQAIDSASAQYPEVLFSNQVAISKPLLLRTTTQQNISLSGSARVTSALMPTAVDIKQPAQNINCLIFNQNNNTHLHLERFEFFSSVAYTGIGIYCVEGGGADASGQCLFSAVFRDMWMGMPTTANGFLRGGMQNCVLDTFNIEGSKGGFIRLEGAGTADVIINNINFLRGFDELINQTADTQGSVLMTVSNVHAYVHFRGRLINVQNWKQANISNIVLEVDTTNVGDTGLFKFKDCSSIQVSNFCATPRVGTATCAVGIEVDTTQAKFSNGKVTADIGFKISGTGAIDIELDGVDFTGCTTAAIQVTAAASGTLRTRNCRFNDAVATAILHSSANSISWYSENDEFVNAGTGGAGGSRNLDLNSSGTIRIIKPRIGKTSGGAAANFFVAANNASGTIDIIDPEILGTAPGGSFSTGTQAVRLDGISGTWTPSVGGNATYTVQQGYYTVKQRVVYFWGRITINVLGTGSQNTFSGLPFTSNATYYGGGEVPFFASSASSLTSLGLTVAPGGTGAALRSLTAASTSTGSANVFQNGADTIFHGSYPL